MDSSFGTPPAGGNATDSRGKDRDSLFLLADIVLAASGQSHRARVRNLSSGGMMAECEMRAEVGEAILTELRNIGQVSGHIAWAREGRFGIAFDQPIDPKLVRKPVTTGNHEPRYTRPAGVYRSSRQF